MFFIGPSFHADGMQITGIIPDSPVDGVLKEGMIISSINGQQITDRTSFITVLNTTKPGDVLTIATNQGTFTIKTASSPHNPSASYIGVRTQENLAIDKDVSMVYGDVLPWLLFGFVTLLQWIFMLNFGIGTFNLLPLKPLDGGLMLEELLNYVTSSNVANKLTNIISVVSLMLVVTSISHSLVPALF
jgi:membrane-associated protease RseP (regulator of RpoE activity)